MVMAKKRRVASARARAGLDISALAGTFAYKFSGYAMEPNRPGPFFLTGLGKFQLDASGNLTGAHRSSYTPLQGLGATIATGAYNLSGTLTVRNDGNGEADILFTKTSGDGKNVRGQFYVLVPGNADHLWMISSGGVLPETNEKSDELVNLEAVRVA
jgi:hypothetical protein